MVSKKHQPTQDTTGNAIGKAIGMGFPGQHSFYHDTRQGAAGFSIALPGGKLPLTRFLLANLSITFFSPNGNIYPSPPLYFGCIPFNFAERLVS